MFRPVSDHHQVHVESYKKKFSQDKVSPLESTKIARYSHNGMTAHNLGIGSNYHSNAVSAFILKRQG
jgi:hypothetical protein